VWERVVGDAIQLAHPMYMGHQVAPPLPHAVLADTLASLLNQSVAVWEMSPTGTPVEQQVVRWMRELVGFPDRRDGTFVSGGSAANLTGLLAAREAVFPGAWAGGVAGGEGLDRAAVFVAAHAHYSMERSLGIMGLGASAAVPVAERDFRLDPDALDRAIDRALAEGRLPLAIVATAGSTATGLFDDLPGHRRHRPRPGHLAARGRRPRRIPPGQRPAAGPAARDRAGRLRGLGPPQDDVHAHLGRRRAGPGPTAPGRGVPAERALPVPPRPGETRSHDMGRRTLQCSRRFDALKVWICLQHYGLDHSPGSRSGPWTTPSTLHRLLSDAGDFEPAHMPPSPTSSASATSPRHGRTAREELDALQGRLREAYNASGRGWITTTVLGGRRVLRVTLMNPATELRHLDALLDGLRETGRAMG
jgi:L-2,4-diaminobutyrate decarboxylase